MFVVNQPSLLKCTDTELFLARIHKKFVVRDLHLLCDLM